MLKLKTFADRFNYLRKKQNLSLYKIAKDLETANSTTRAWGSGKSEPRGGNLLKLAEYLNADPAWLRFGEKQLDLNIEVLALARKIDSYIKKHPEGWPKIKAVIEAMIK